jgi:Fic family protein
MYTPKYAITNKILTNIGIIEACREVNEKEFQKDALVRTVHHGTHIEGNSLDMSQTEKVMMGEQVIARARDIQEVINYRHVMDYLGNIQTASFVITEEIIKHLHKMTVDKILALDRSGEYRTTQVVVRNSLTGDVTFTPPAAMAVSTQMQGLIDFMNKEKADEIHPVIKSGTIHYEFVRIHPFVDGNGRVARALSTFILFQEGYDIRKFFSLEEYFDSDAQGYYSALQRVGRHFDDLSSWLEYFTHGLAIELSKIKDKIEKISVDGKLKEKLGGEPILLSDRQLKLIEYIQKTGYLQNSVFKQLFPMVSEDTVLNELKYLIKHGLVKKQGSTKGAKYVMEK